MTTTNRITASAGMALAVWACGDGTAPAPAEVSGRLATVEQEDAGFALYLQDLDGAERIRVRFEPVVEEVNAIGQLSWSPDGRTLAVVVILGPEMAQVVLVDNAGNALRAASPGSQWIGGRVEWSPDSRAIAYIMATLPQAFDPELFVTDLEGDRLIQLTSGKNLAYGDDAYRFDEAGTGVYFTERLGWAPDGMNGRHRLYHVGIGSGVVTGGMEFEGQPQDLARDGTWGLIMHWAADPEATELKRKWFSPPHEEILVRGVLAHAALLEDETEALVALDDLTSETRTFQLFGVRGPEEAGEVIATGESVLWAALWMEPWPDRW